MKGRPSYWLGALVLLLAFCRLPLAAAIPLSADEGFYWLWTRPLQLSYYDHPAMVAWWIWSGTHLLGDTVLGIRLFAVIGSTLATILIWDLTNRSFYRHDLGSTAGFWLNSTILFAAAGIVITPDAPLLFFWSLCLWASIRLLQDESPVYLYLIGLALGLGVLSKYTMILILPGLLAVFVLFPQHRHWWRSVHLYLAALLALACTSPLILWNWRNGGASFHKQFNHAFANPSGGGFQDLATYLGSQFGLITPLIFLCSLWGMGWALWSGWQNRRAEWFLLGTTSLPILIFFTFHTQTAGVQAHWAGPAYLGGIAATVGAGASLTEKRSWQRLFTWAPWLGLSLCAIVFFQAATALLPIPPKLDPLKRLGGWTELADAVAEAHAKDPAAFIFTGRHEVTGIVSFYMADHPLIFQRGSIRPSYYTAAEVAALKGRDGLFITRARYDAAPEIAPFFESVTPIRSVEMHWGGRPADAYNLYFAKGYHGGAFPQGDGSPAALDLP